MREIKFRGQMKTTKGKKWVYGNYYKVKSFFDDKEKTYIGAIRGNHLQDLVVDEKTLGQFTGLHDKNGKEIYEGDIVVIEVFNYMEPEWSGEFEVTYSEDLASYILEDLEDIANFNTMNTIKGYYKYEIEVIGNIYDNKELLKEDK